jgi:hypothetical protein
MRHESVRVHAIVVVFKDGKLVVPAREDEGSSIENILLNARTAHYAAFGPSVDVRLSNVREVPLRFY